MRLMLLCSLTALCSAVQAAPVLYDGGLPDLRQGYVSDYHDPGGTRAEVADRFGAAAPGHVAVPRTLRWWGGYLFGDGAPAGDLFSVRLWSDSLPAPTGEPLHAKSFYPANPVSRTATGQFLVTATGEQGAQIYEYAVQVGEQWTLAPGSAYWLAIQNDTTGDDDSWFWATSHATAGAATWREHYGSWGSLQASMAFQIEFDDPDAPPASVPEPHSLTLLGGGLAALWFTARRRMQERHAEGRARHP
ncbi:PEP-CTERM sorting domain-containing protein [Aquincola tertiaricarbonis]|uniref:PEP-CTERM sorting domain-containing protein n=1 Tax=Aquincola tertiaricarbonis TaxID=391953 RepID=UPI000614C2A8|nr:PEP-CTERM sorting domain-containing protein [Aquincola tertiaricarbonis]